MAFSMLGTPDAPFYTSQNTSPAVRGIVIGEKTRDFLTVPSGWARRPKHGETLGRNTVDRYKSDISDMFLAGEADKSLKLSPSQMLSRLRLKYPGRYDIPAEQFVARCVQGLVYQAKKAKRDATVSQRGVRGQYANAILQLLDSNPGLMPRRVRSSVIETLGLAESNLPSDFPSESQLKSKLSSLKAKRNKELSGAV